MLDENIPDGFSVLFASSLPDDEDAIRELFLDFGTIRTIRLLPQRKYHRTRAGIITMSCNAEASAAMNKLNGKLIEDTGTRLRVNWDLQSLGRTKGGEDQWKNEFLSNSEGAGVELRSNGSGNGPFEDVDVSQKSCTFTSLEHHDLDLESEKKTAEQRKGKIGWKERYGSRLRSHAGIPRPLSTIRTSLWKGHSASTSPFGTSSYSSSTTESHSGLVNSSIFDDSASVTSAYSSAHCNESVEASATLPRAPANSAVVARPTGFVRHVQEVQTLSTPFVQSSLTEELRGTQFILHIPESQTASSETSSVSAASGGPDQASYFNESTPVVSDFGNLKVNANVTTNRELSVASENLVGELSRRTGLMPYIQEPQTTSSSSSSSVAAADSGLTESCILNSSDPVIVDFGNLECNVSARTLLETSGNSRRTGFLRHFQEPLQTQIYSSAASEDRTVAWRGILPTRNCRRHSEFSCKVFLDGVPCDITEADIQTAFGRFGSVKIEWPVTHDQRTRDLHLIFETEKSVRQLLLSCHYAVNRGHHTWHYAVSSISRPMQEVQVIPWRPDDANYVRNGCLISSFRTNTVVVRNLHTILTSKSLAKVLDEVFEGVVAASLDQDEYKYPIGSGRVTFSSHESFMKALGTSCVDIYSPTLTRRILIDPCCDDSGRVVCQPLVGQLPLATAMTPTLSDHLLTFDRTIESDQYPDDSGLIADFMCSKPSRMVTLMPMPPAAPEPSAPPVDNCNSRSILTPAQRFQLSRVPTGLLLPSKSVYCTADQPKKIAVIPVGMGGISPKIAALPRILTRLEVQERQLLMKLVNIQLGLG